MVQNFSDDYEMKRKQLNENETYIQLCAVEQKLRLHESNNFHLKDCKHFTLTPRYCIKDS